MWRAWISVPAIRRPAGCTEERLVGSHRHEAPGPPFPQGEREVAVEEADGVDVPDVEAARRRGEATLFRRHALREAHEEIGLAPERVQPLGCLNPVMTITGYAMVPFVA